MKRFAIIAAVIAGMIVAGGCQQGGDPTREAIASQLEMYPESRVQDIYKSFCQDNLGPGHLIPSPERARAYLLSELEEYRRDLDSGRYTKPEVRYVPVGDKGNYVRVDLAVVLDGEVSADALLDALVRSANEGVVLTEAEWKEKWAGVAEVIRKHFPDIPGEAGDLAAIDSLMAEGNLILHHSEAFEQAYHPHYRIIAKDILP